MKIGPARRASSRADGPVKKALLIGINYTNAPPHPEYTPLCHARDDTKEFADLLIAKYGYRRENIVMLLDEEEGDIHYAPTRDNILREIRKLVYGARSGDSFMFYYSGHSGQVESPNTEEDDGMDEYLVPVDHWQYSEEAAMKKRMILDNKLRKLLVDTLPNDANLTAIFDSCHSGTLLDLDHYLCNNVYFPWSSPGFRNQKTMWRQVRRKNGYHMSQVGVKVITKKLPSSSGAGRQQSPLSRKTSASSVRMYQRKRVSQDEVLVMNTSVGIFDTDDGKARQFSICSRSKTVKRRPSSMLSQLLDGCESQLSLDIKEQSPGTINEDYDAPICASPTDMRVCNGWCDKSQKPSDPKPRGPNVVSISACGDSQMTWDSKKHSFTHSLIEMLKLQPHQPLGQLIQSLTYQLHDHSRRLHTWSKKRRDSWKQRSKGHVGDPGSQVTESDEPETTLELENFTEPQLALALVNTV
ncbi:Metacaspase-1 [Trametes pubescens]|uniref:Metacaspase-1 n=1 Tax=Trametes pubescens TaxID=154538 RepID=A0A1M2VKC6_TRAPU|nr:Metacaspase-1 [Trametes pubescens]